MSEPIAPPPPPPPPPVAPAKKKTSPLAWVLIGCGIIVVVGGIVVVVMLAAAGWFVKKTAAKFEENPAVATAELAVRANPDLEVVESDTKAGTITVRNTKTGEVMTWNAKDIEEGKFSVTTSEGTATFQGTTGQEGGTFKVTNEKGEQATFTAGGGAPKNLPAWLPTYPGGAVEGSFDTTSGEGRSASFTVTTTDPIPQVLDFYKSQLEAAGLKVEKNTVEANGTISLGTVTGTSADQKRAANVMVSTSEGKTSAVVSFTEKP